MQYNKLGRAGIKISAVGLGTMYFGKRVNESDATVIIDTAFEKGINLIDTANVYTGGLSEEIVGKAVKNKRHAMLLATKVNYRLGKGPNDCGLSRKHIVKAVEDSLKRLDTDYIDIYYAHAPDYNTPIEETLRAFDNLVHQGKVRYLACSNFWAWQLVEALWVSEKHNLARFDCIQSPYNLFTRDIESELLPCCAKEGVGVTVYNPLAAGLLTGKYDQKTSPAPNSRLGLEPIDKNIYWSTINFQAVTYLKKIADSSGLSLAGFSLAWILNNPVISSIIIGVSSTKQLEDNIGTVDLKLTGEQIKACDEVWRQLKPPRFSYGR